MKLGSQTGSLTNHILSRAVIGQPEPVVGMGATILGWTDRHAATIVNVGKEVIVVQEDNATRTYRGPMSEAQKWEHSRNVSGFLYYFRRTKTGQWEEVTRNDKTGRWNKTNGHGLRIGERDHYYDPSF